VSEFKPTTIFAEVKSRWYRPTVVGLLRLLEKKMPSALSFLRGTSPNPTPAVGFLFA